MGEPKNPVECDRLTGGMGRFRLVDAAYNGENGIHWDSNDLDLGRGDWTCCRCGHRFDEHPSWPHGKGPPFARAAGRDPLLRATRWLCGVWALALIALAVWAVPQGHWWVPVGAAVPFLGSVLAVWLSGKTAYRS